MDGFFGIGFGELVMIAIVALIVLGPERLPSALREVAKFIRQVRNLSQEFTSQFGDDFKALEDLNPRRLLQEAIDNIDEEENAKDGKAKTPAKKSTTPTTAAKKTTATPAKPAAVKNGVAKSTTASATTSTTTGVATKSTETTPVVTTKSADAELAAAETASANEDTATILSEKAETAGPKVEATSGIEVDVAASNSAPTAARPADEPENRIAPPDRAEPSAAQASVAETNQPSLAEPSQAVAQTNGHVGSSTSIDNTNKVASVLPVSATDDESLQASAVSVPTEPAVEHKGQLESEETRL